MIETEDRQVDVSMVDALDLVTDNVAEDLVNNIKIGTYVVRQEEGFYSIYDEKNTLIRSDISFFTLGVLVCNALAKNDKKIIKKVLWAEENFAKKYNDMLFYKRTSNWELYESAKMDALDFLWEIKKLIKSKI